MSKLISLKEAIATYLKDGDVLADVVMAELKDIMEVRSEPDFVKVYTHGKGIPQYSLGHEKRLGRIDEALSSFKHLYITGNAYRGIGVNDCVENSHKLAERIIDNI